MEFTKKTTGTRDLHMHFNMLVNEQSRSDLLDRIAALNGNDTGLMFYDLVGFMRGRIKQNDLVIEAMRRSSLLRGLGRHRWGRFRLSAG